MPKGLLHLEAGIQSLHEEVLTVSRRAGKLADALEGLRYLCALDNMETHADLIAGLPLYHLSQISTTYARWPNTVREKSSWNL